MSSSLLFPHFLFVLLESILRWEASCRIAEILWGVTSRICLKQHLTFLYSFFSKRFRVHVVHPYRSIDTAIAWKKSRNISSDRSDFYTMYNLSTAVHMLPRFMLTLLSVDEILLPGYVKLYTNFRGLPIKVEMALSLLNQMNFILLVFM